MDLRAVIFVPALTGSVILGFVFLLFAANYYLTVMESTGVGAKEVTWFSEPILDNAWKVAYMAWLIGLWLIPAYFIGRAVTAGVDSIWWRLAVPLMVFWLCYPISQMSSLSATSIWFPLVPDVFARLLQKPFVYFGFMLLSIPVLTVLCIGFKWAFLTEDEWELLIIGVPMMVVSGLMYARLIGRLGYALRFTRSIFTEKKKQKPQRVKAATVTAEYNPDEYFTQPSDLPPIKTPNDGELSGYNLKLEDNPPPQFKKRVKAEAVESDAELESTPETRAESTHNPEPEQTPRSPVRKAPSRSIERNRVWTDEDEEVATAYGMHETEVQPGEQVPQELIKPREDELRLLRRDDVPKRPKQIWSMELFVFLAQNGTIMAIVICSGLCFMAGVMVRVARFFNPAGSAE
jgi:hypothetical protein